MRCEREREARWTWTEPQPSHQHRGPRFPSPVSHVVCGSPLLGGKLEQHRVKALTSGTSECDCA